MQGTVQGVSGDRNVKDSALKSILSGKRGQQKDVSSKERSASSSVEGMSRNVLRVLKVGQDFDRHKYEDRVSLVKRMLN